MALFTLSVLFAVGICALYGFSDRALPQLSLTARGVQNEQIVPSLMLGDEEEMPFLVPFIEEFSFRCLDKRPDVPMGNNYILLIDKKLNQYAVKSGSTVYLDYNREKRAITPSSKETPLSIIPKMQEDGRLFVEAELLLPSIKQTATFFLGQAGSDVELKMSEELKYYMRGLQKAKAHPPDTMFKIYGGPQYAPLQNLYRLELPQTKGAELFFLAPGDLLVYDSGAWRKKIPGENSCLYPLLHVAKISEQKMDLVIFDVEGKESTSLPLFVTCPKLKTLNAGEIFGIARKRTPYSISCKMGKKSRILQEGDWLIQNGASWEVVQSADQLEKLLDYKIACDLIILDTIEKAGMTGYYFDAKRSVSQKIVIPLVEEKSKKKNPPSATIEGHESKK